MFLVLVGSQQSSTAVTYASLRSYGTDPTNITLKKELEETPFPSVTRPHLAHFTQYVHVLWIHTLAIFTDKKTFLTVSEAPVYFYIDQLVLHSKLLNHLLRNRETEDVNQPLKVCDMRSRGGIC